jgi:hypothetical protein
MMVPLAFRYERKPFLYALGIGLHEMFGERGAEAHLHVVQRALRGPFLSNLIVAKPPFSRSGAGRWIL